MPNGRRRLSRLNLIQPVARIAASTSPPHPLKWLKSNDLPANMKRESLRFLTKRTFADKLQCLVLLSPAHGRVVELLVDLMLKNLGSS